MLGTSRIEKSIIKMNIRKNCHRDLLKDPGNISVNPLRYTCNYVILDVADVIQPNLV